jgi:hypothetical protein
MYTSTFRGLAALLTFVVAASSACAGPETPPNDDKLSQVLTQLQEVTNRLGAIQIRQDIQIQSMQNDVSQLKTDVSRLNEEIRRFSTERTNIAASINPEVAAPVTAALILTNHYSVPATFYVNGRPIRVPPSQQARVMHPVGRFSYEIYTDDRTIPVQPLSDRFLIPGRDYPITLNP